MIFGMSEEEKTEYERIKYRCIKEELKQKVKDTLESVGFAWYPRKLTDGRWIFLEKYTQKAVVISNPSNGRETEIVLPDSKSVERFMNSLTFSFYINLEKVTVLSKAHKPVKER